MKYLLTFLLIMTGLQATQTQVIILLGPPGAGKGSQAALIQEKQQIAHISTGDLLRSSIKEGTDLGMKAKTYMNKGELVPDDLIFDMLFERTSREDCTNGYMLDGFPRNLQQAEELQKRLKGHNVIAINLHVPDDAIVERITQRQICTSCQAPFHLVYSPPSTPGVCDRCSGQLYQRDDDKQEIVESRLKVYHEKTEPLIAYYKKQNVLHDVDSSRSKETILEDIMKLLKTS